MFETLQALWQLGTHQVGRKEGNVLFNDALKIFYFGYMESDIWTPKTVRKETHYCFVFISSKGSLPTDRIAHSTAFAIPVI